LFPILVPIDPRLLKAWDKTMQGGGHDINVICKMFRPMSKGIFTRFRPRPRLKRHGDFTHNSNVPKHSAIVWYGTKHKDAQYYSAWADSTHGPLNN